MMKVNPFDMDPVDNEDIGLVFVIPEDDEDTSSTPPSVDTHDVSHEDDTEHADNDHSQVDYPIHVDRSSQGDHHASLIVDRHTDTASSHDDHPLSGHGDSRESSDQHENADDGLVFVIPDDPTTEDMTLGKDDHGDGSLSNGDNHMAGHHDDVSNDDVVGRDDGQDAIRVGRDVVVGGDDHVHDADTNDDNHIMSHHTREDDDRDGDDGEWVEGDGDDDDAWDLDDIDDGVVEDRDDGGDDEPDDMVSVSTALDEDGASGSGDRGFRGPAGRYHGVMASEVDAPVEGGRDAGRPVDGVALQEGIALGGGRGAARRVSEVYGGVAGRLHEFAQVADIDPELARDLQVLEWKLRRPVRFTRRDVGALDFLSRWSYSTSAQLARVGGWRDKTASRVDRRFDSWVDLGFARCAQLFAGPRLWMVTDAGCVHSRHPWLGGVSMDRLNPLSQSHTLGLSSVASWLLSGRDDAPDVLGLGGDEWSRVRGELADGDAELVSEREYRSAYSKIRQGHRGLLPVAYRRGLLGGVGPGGEHVDSWYADWARAVKRGDEGVEDAPDWAALRPDARGADMWLWVIWGNDVWSDGGLTPIEQRLDVASNRPRLRRDLGDEFALLDHLPDMVVARKRRMGDGSSRSLAVELELSEKKTVEYKRILASYACDLGKTLYDRVIWLVPNHMIGDAITRAGDALGLVHGEDYSVVPFATAERRNSFVTGADIVPARWVGRHHRVEPVIDPASVLLS
jgi:hypothetical protein